MKNLRPVFLEIASLIVVGSNFHARPESNRLAETPMTLRQVTDRVADHLWPPFRQKCAW